MFCACIILSSGVKRSWPQVSVKALCVCGTVTESVLGTAVLFKTPDLHVQGQTVWDMVWTEQKIASVVLGVPTCLVITTQLEGLGENREKANESLPRTQHLAWCPRFPGPSFSMVPPVILSVSPTPGGHSEGHPAHSSGSPLWHAELKHEFE